MADPQTRSPWGHRALFVMLVLLIVLFQLLPLETTPRRWAGPDLMVALTLAWAARRPATVPALLIAAVFLLGDMLFHRPPGLWAALMVAACEWLRSQSRGFAVQGFAAEWLGVAVALTVITLLNRVILALTITPSAPLSLTLMQLAMTLAIYPVVVAISHFVFGIRRTRRGDSTGGLA